MKTLQEFMIWTLVESLLCEGSFSVENLKSIPSHDDFNTEIAYLTRYLTQTLGQPNTDGSYRLVWSIDDTHVIKLVKRSGFANQNQNEKTNAACLGTSHSIQVFDHHPRFFWIVEEQVKPLSEKEFSHEFGKKVGIKFGARTQLKSGIYTNTTLMISDVIEELVEERPSARYEGLHDQFQKSPWFNDLIQALQGCKVSSQDLHWGNWGIRPSTGELVILDLGF